VRERQAHGVSRPRVGPFPKWSQIRYFHSFPRFRSARTPCACRCRVGHGAPVGGGDGGTHGCAVGGGASGVSGPPKNEIFVHLGRGTPQKRLRNGWRNGRFLAKVTSSVSPRGNQQSWGVALPSDQASRRSSPACAGVPPGPFPPTLYLKRRAGIFGSISDLNEGLVQ
jgi:hypothetical protein